MDKRYARRIAARGITPNHKGKTIEVPEYAKGTLIGFEHFDKTTVLTLSTPNSGWSSVTLDIDHLEEVIVYD